MEGYGWGFLAEDDPWAVLKAQVMAMNVGGEVMSESKEIDVHLLRQELGVMHHPLADDARTVIERLTAEVAKERGSADRYSMERDKARAEVERLKGVLQRLGSAEAFDMARALDAKDAELIMRMDFARSALEAKP